MPGIDDRVVAKRKQHRPDRGDERRMVATRQIRAANRSGEQRVADEQRRGRSRRFRPICRQTPPGQWPGVWCGRAS